MKKQNSVFLILLITMSIYSCQISNQVPTSTSAISSTNFPVISSPTQTDNIIVSSTSTSTPLTATSFPTLNPEQAIKKLSEIFGANGFCKFPCLLNILPGKTSWEDAQKSLLILRPNIKSSVVENYKSHEIKIDLSDSGYNTKIRVYEKNNLVEFIAIESFLSEANLKKVYSNYAPREIIQSYGIPSQVLISTSLVGEGSYILNLFYDDIGLLISYGGKIQKITDKGVVVCPNFSAGNIGGIQIFIQSKDIGTGIENFPDEELLMRKKISVTNLHPIKDAAGLTTKDFSLFLRERQDYCFTVQK